MTSKFCNPLGVSMGTEPFRDATQDLPENHTSSITVAITGYQCDDDYISNGRRTKKKQQEGPHLQNKQRKEQHHSLQDTTVTYCHTSPGTTHGLPGSHTPCLHSRLAHWTVVDISGWLWRTGRTW